VENKVVTPNVVEVKAKGIILEHISTNIKNMIDPQNIEKDEEDWFNKFSILNKFPTHCQHKSSIHPQW